MQVIAAVAEFERDLLIERTHSGISRAKEAGKRFGRPPSLNIKERALVIERLSGGAGLAELAREFKTTRQTIMRVREAAAKLQRVRFKVMQRRADRFQLLLFQPVANRPPIRGWRGLTAGPTSLRHAPATTTPRGV